jgi:hypothetical protein
MDQPLLQNTLTMGTRKIVIVARRDKRRIVRWQGLLAIVLVYQAIGVPIFFGGLFLVTRTGPSAAGILTFFIFPLLIFLGNVIGRLLSMPLHELPLRDEDGG